MAKDKTKAKAGPVSGDRIKSFIERVEKLLEERKAIQQDIGDVFHEAKGVGYDVKTMRKLINIRAMDAADRAEQEALLDTYAHAIGMDTSSIMFQPSEEDLIEKATRIIVEVDRCVSLVRSGKLPKIADIQDLIGCSAGKASKLRAMVADRISRSNAVSVKTGNENPPHDPQTGEISPARQAAEQLFEGGGVTVEVNAEPGSLLDRVGAELEKVAPDQVTRNVPVGRDDDDLQIPSFLRRQPEPTP